jgi:tRNA threonylcarbamoyladenosine dehydratase
MHDDSSSSPEARRHSRTIDLVGSEGFARLRGSLVVVAGLGGVGSHAAVGLARAGVGRLRLIDFDTVSWTSLNRSAFARPADVGQPKAAALASFLAAIDFELQVEPMHLFFHDDTAERVLAGRPDFVIDAIDSVTPKLALLRGCHARGLPVVSCMGASARTDPLQLQVGDIAETRGCPLARVIRKELRHHGIERGVLCVYSLEPGRAPLEPDLEDETLRRGRVRRRLPSLSTLPGIFGYTAASLVIARLAGLEPRELT